MNPIIESTNRNGHDRAADRAATNRANAEKSTGPRTPAGKQRSSLNALRHGLTGQTVVLPTEDHAAYQRHSQLFLDEYQPNGATETQLVQSLIDIAWRQNRIAAIETNLLSLGIIENESSVEASHPEAAAALAMAVTFRRHARDFANISIYGQRLSRQFERTLAQLREVQEARRTAAKQELHQAAAILKMHQADDLPYDPADDGFVFSIAELNTFIRRDDRRFQANVRAFSAHA